MKNLLHILMVLMTSTLFANPNATKVDFINGSLSLAQQKAGQEGKLLFVEFGAKWCMPCRFMEENTFKDQEVVAYMAESYVPVKIDIDDFDGFAYKQKYKVEALPTFIIFNSAGEIVDRQEKSMAPSNLLNVLRQNNIDHNKRIITGNLSAFEIEQKIHEAEKARLNVNPYQTEPASNPVEETITEQPTPTSTEIHDGPIIQEPLVDITTIGDIIAAADTEEEQETIKVEEVESTSIDPIDETVVETDGQLLWEEDYEMAEEKEAYETEAIATNENLLEASKPKITFYSVRVGTFANQRSMNDYVKATSAIFIEDTHIFENSIDGASTFEVCLGAFASRASAEKFIERLRMLNIPGEVKTVEQE